MVVTAASFNADKPRTINRSCIQCRERKIKCDRLDPCNHCVSKGMGNECRHELRKKRAKNKRPFPKRKSRIAVSSSSTYNLTSTAQPSRSNASPKRSPLAWAERPMTSVSQHSEQSQTPSSSSGRVITPNTSSSLHGYVNPAKFGCSNTVSSLPKPSLPSSYRDSQNGGYSDTGDASIDDSDGDGYESQPDDRLHLIEADQLMHIKSAPLYRCPFALKDVYAEWRAMPVENRRSLIQEIRCALPSLAQSLRLLHDVYVQRLQSIQGNIVHVPTIQVVLTEMLSEPDFEQRDRYAFGHITTALMVIFCSLRYAPLDRTYTWGRSSSTGSPVEPLRQKEMRQRERKIFSLVKRIQHFESSFAFGSVAELQTAVLMLECGKGSAAYQDMLADCAVRSAMRMRIHRLGSFERLHGTKIRPQQVITVEMAIRCWWSLVRRDWSQSNKNRSYRISPLQFNTRQPLNLFDDELLQIPCRRSHLRSTWTPVSYSFATTDFAIMTRTLVDQVNSQCDLDDGPDSAQGWGLASVFGQRLSAVQRDSLDRMFQSLVASFPAHYSLEARYEVIGLVDVERWLLHQRLFHLFLTLHMPLVSEATRPHGSLMYMAGHILDIQEKVADICTRLDNCHLHTLQTLRACLVLLLDLFFAQTPVNISGLSRLMTRRKITAALEKIPTDVIPSTSKLLIRLVHQLLSLENQQHQLQFGVDASAGDAHLSQAGAADETPLLDAAGLLHRWHATCQILDVLLNEGYWRSLRKNLRELDQDSLIPDWLRKSLGDEFEDPSRIAPAQEESLLATTHVSTAQSATSALSASSLAPETKTEAPYATSSQAALPSFDSADLSLTFDPKLLNNLDDLNVLDLQTAGETSQLPQLDLDLIGYQDFEGFGNASQSVDFAKMLNEWRVEVPLA